MSFKLYETVCLLVDFPEEGLKKGNEGTVVMIHEEPSEAYEVEFVDNEGRTVAQIAVLPTQLTKLN